MSRCRPKVSSSTAKNFTSYFWSIDSLITNMWWSSSKSSSTSPSSKRPEWVIIPNSIIRLDRLQIHTPQWHMSGTSSITRDTSKCTSAVSPMALFLISSAQTPLPKQVRICSSMGCPRVISSKLRWRLKTPKDISTSNSSNRSWTMRIWGTGWSCTTTTATWSLVGLSRPKTTNSHNSSTPQYLWSC